MPDKHYILNSIKSLQSETSESEQEGCDAFESSIKAIVGHPKDDWASGEGQGIGEKA